MSTRVPFVFLCSFGIIKSPIALENARQSHSCQSSQHTNKTKDCTWCWSYEAFHSLAC